MKTNNVLMAEAWEIMSLKWKEIVGVFIVVFLLNIVTGSVSEMSLGASTILYTGPMSVGIAYYLLNIVNGRTYSLNNIFYGFKNIGRHIWASVVLFVYLFWRYILLIVPGIIASISYAQTYFILAEDETISAKEAILKSKKMMYGHKSAYFYLQLRFIGWFFLSILTLGIGFFFLIPYIKITNAKFYQNLKSLEQVASEIL